MPGKSEEGMVEISYKEIHNLIGYEKVKYKNCKKVQYSKVQ